MSTITTAPAGRPDITRGRRASEVRLNIDVQVPTSADAGGVLGMLHRAARNGEGITIVMPDGKYKVDVDLVRVQEVMSA